jgi:NAD(P)H-binding
LLQSGRPCIATTRTGKYDFHNAVGDLSEAAAALLTTMACDVTDPASLDAAIGGTSQQKLAGVIYAASASKRGGTPQEVDRDGAIAAARACIAHDVPRFVLVSSGAVTRPDSSIYLILNSFGKIIEAKIAGEDAVRAMYAHEQVTGKDGNNLGYTVIRPGGLTLEPSVGVSSLELNQGDRISGRLPRADVAALCVESIYSEYTLDTTFECYEASTAKPLESVGLSNICECFCGIFCVQCACFRRL